MLLLDAFHLGEILDLLGTLALLRVRGFAHLPLFIQPFQFCRFAYLLLAPALLLTHRLLDLELPFVALDQGSRDRCKFTIRIAITVGIQHRWNGAVLDRRPEG